MSDRIHPAIAATALVGGDCCGQPMRDTTCDAPDCGGMACGVCGGGCDITVPGGRCEVAMVAEPPDGRDARFAADRAQLGFPDPPTAPEQLDLIIEGGS